MMEQEIEKRVKEWLDGPGEKWGFSLSEDGKEVVDGMCHTGHYTFEEIYRRWIKPHEKNSK